MNGVSTSSEICLMMKTTKQKIIGLFKVPTGSGKSTTINNYANFDHTILFVTPTNKLAQQIKRKGRYAITVHMLLGIYGDGQQYAKTRKINVDNYDCVCFDEIYMN